VADYFIDLGDIADKVRKEPSHSHRYYDNNHAHEPQQHAANSYAGHAQPAQDNPDEMMSHAHDLLSDAEEEAEGGRRTDEFDEGLPQLVADTGGPECERLAHNPDFIRVTDDQ